MIQKKSKLPGFDPLLCFLVTKEAFGSEVYQEYLPSGNLVDVPDKLIKSILGHDSLLGSLEDSKTNCYLN